MNLQAQRDLSIAGDVVGGDKITNIYQTGEKKERPAPHMAPPAPRVFIGRDEVLCELIAALKLSEDGTGPIALTALKGMGGIGKTTLAAALANNPEVEAALPEGTLWAGLGPEPEVMSLLAEWGAQLGEDFAQLDFPEARSRRLSTLLRNKKALLIVDDVWQAEPARFFLVGGPHCRALFTTRDNEVARKLAGHEAIRVEILTNAASLNLLRELAPEAVSADENAANEMATSLDGLPLALTLTGQMLAAEWEAGMGVAGALSELKDREARLKLAGAEKRAGLQTTEPSLGAILAMSYDRLPDETTKRAFRLLGVFGGKPLTFSIEAAASVWGMEFRQAQKTMVALVGRALIEPMKSGRYTLHTTLADFAESLLEGHDEAALARETHANYYLEFAQENAEKNWQMVEIEMEQIRKGFQSADGITHKQMVLDYYGAMSIFFNRRGHWSEEMNWAETALAVARAMGDRIAEGTLLNHIGLIHQRRNEWDRALECYEMSGTIFEEIGEQAGLAVTLSNLGFAYTNKGLWDEALKYLDRSQTICEEIGDRAKLAVTLDHIGYMYREKGAWNKALEYYEASRAIEEEIKDLDGLAAALKHIGIIYFKKGAWDKALEYLKHSCSFWREIGDQRGLAHSLWHMSDVYEKQEQFADAEQVLIQAVTIFEALESPELDSAGKQLDKIRELQQNTSQK